MRYGIRPQLLTPLALLLAAVLGVSAAAAVDAAHAARRQTVEQVRSIARTLADGPFPLTNRVLAQMKGLSGAEYLLAGGPGRAATFDAAGVELPAAGYPQSGSAAGEPHTVAVAGADYLCWGVALRPPHPDAGATLYLFYPESRLREAQWQAAWPSLLVGGVGGLVAAAGMALVGGRLVRRLRELERRTRQIAAGEFGPMPLPTPDDELTDLTRSVNEMAGRLARMQEAAEKSERLRLLGQVSGGLAHQLRNGVAGARLAVQLHARSCAGPHADDLQVCLRQLALVESNLARFLDLGRGDAPRRERCRLDEVVGESLDLLRPQCRHAGAELRWTPPGPVEVTADAGQLRHLVLNLAGNAVEAAGAGGTVEVVLAAGDPVRLEVWDTGPGPPAELAGRLFEPFVTGKRDGVGLGLAVARQAAEAHGGRLSWRREGGRTLFLAEVPAGASAAAGPSKG